MRLRLVTSEGASRPSFMRSIKSIPPAFTTRTSPDRSPPSGASIASATSPAAAAACESVWALLKAKLRMGQVLPGSFPSAASTAVGVIGSERSRTPIAL